MNPVDAVTAFTGAALLVTLTPGPDMLVVTRALVVAGVRAGMSTAAGVCSGVLIWGVAAATGLAAVLTAVPGMFRAIQLLGAYYLFWLGIGFVRRSRHLPDEVIDATRLGESPSLAGSFRTGLLTNALNPKIGVFYLGFLPPFLPPGYSPALFGAALAGIHATIGMLIFGVLAVTAGGRRFSVGRWRPRLDLVSGLGLCGFGALLLYGAWR
ncbi:LysE family translocator [Mycobacterium sp. smrl_JER01]|uniref:LysE family translocator n=1 Tax=Mycobacterium sp. smrl_JER01 TaxID=3402633 RepID=UPI003AD403F9